jgi:hypothetical protein
MRATNFGVRSGICFVVEGAQLDMHNDYDFAALSYDVPTRSRHLVWRRRTVGQPAEVMLEIRDVTRATIPSSRRATATR